LTGGLLVSTGASLCEKVFHPFPQGSCRRARSSAVIGARSLAATGRCRELEDREASSTVRRSRSRYGSGCSPEGGTLFLGSPALRVRDPEPSHPSAEAPLPARASASGWNNAFRSSHLRSLRSSRVRASRRQAGLNLLPPKCAVGRPDFRTSARTREPARTGSIPRSPRVSQAIGRYTNSRRAYFYENSRGGVGRARRGRGARGGS
jgi:hypothetical protein